MDHDLGNGPIILQEWTNEIWLLEDLEDSPSQCGLGWTENTRYSSKEGARTVGEMKGHLTTLIDSYHLSKCQTPESRHQTTALSLSANCHVIPMQSAVYNF